MDIVLGVSMTPTTVRMALVEGKDADGATLDQDSFDVAGGLSPATSDAAEQVVAAILGTRESAAEGGHHLVATGVAWTDHAAAARLRQALKAQRIEDVVLVSELHAASALAQAIGQAAELQRTALLFLERDTATLAVVRSDDGSVVKVVSRSLDPATAVAELQEMVEGLDAGSQPPQTLFMVGSGVDIAALKPQIAARTSLPVHAPDDGDLALARGAALAAANTPRYEAATVGLLSTDDTAAGATQMAAAGYMAPLGYSAVPDDDADALDPDLLDSDLLDPDLSDPDAEAPPAERRFVLIGSALSTLFVFGVVALVISMAVAIRPTADQRPVPGDSAVVSNSQAPAPPQARPPAPPPAAPETIEAPIPVVQEAPRTVFVAPPAAVPAPAVPAQAPAAPAPAPAPPPASAPAAPAPAPASPPPAAPAPASAPAPAPVPAFVPPIVVPIPIVPSLLPPIFQVPTRSTPVPRYPTTTVTPTPTTPAPTQVLAPTASPAPTSTPTATYPTSSEAPAPQPTFAPSTTGYPTYTPPVTTIAPNYGSSSSGEGSAPVDSGSGGESSADQTIWPPLWPLGD